MLMLIKTYGTHHAKYFVIGIWNTKYQTNKKYLKKYLNTKINTGIWYFI